MNALDKKNIHDINIRAMTAFEIKKATKMAIKMKKIGELLKTTGGIKRDKNKIEQVDKKNKIEQVDKKNKIEQVDKKNKIEQVDKKNKIEQVDKKSILNINKEQQTINKEIQNNTNEKKTEKELKIEKNENSEERVPDAKNALFTSKEKIYYKMIDEYLRKIPIENIYKMIKIINGESTISLRLLDWFVTKYSNIKNVSYIKENSDEDIFSKKFTVYISYKSQLRSYKKRYFDPFRRRDKFMYQYDKKEKNKTMLTTIGQLNFFKWAFDNGVIKYVETNLGDILKEMMKYNKNNKNIKVQKNKRETDTDPDPDTDTDIDTDTDNSNNSNNSNESKKSKSNISMKSNTTENKSTILSFD
jgi:hypothetical protein